MEIYKIKKYLKDKNESYIGKMFYLNEEYIQTIKLIKKTIKITYYKIKDNNLIEETDEEILKELSSRYESIPDDRMYIGIFEKKKNIGNNKKEDQEIKEWTQKFSSETLESCKLFTEVYGKRFAEKKMETLDKLYIEESDGTWAGYQGDKYITLCKRPGDPESKYTLKEIKKDEKMHQVLLHESIHLVLRRNKEIAGLNPSGMIRYVKRSKIWENSNSSEYIEVGRALNEGLTEWISEKCGYEPGKGYLRYTNFIRELELAIGPKKVIELGKGKNLEKLLNLSEQQVYAFFMKADYIYNCKERIEEIEKYLEPIKTENMAENERKLYEDPNYNRVVNGKEYFIFLKDRKLEHSYENFLLYYKDMIDGYVKEIENATLDIENSIYEQYFRKGLDFAFNFERPMPKEFIVRYAKFRQCIFDSGFRLIERTGSTTKFLKDFDVLYKRYSDSILQEAKENKEMTKSEFLKYFDDLSVFEGAIKYKVFTEEQDELLKLKLSDLKEKDKEIMLFFIKDLYHMGKLEEMDHYTLKKIIAKDGAIDKICYRDGKIVDDYRFCKEIKITDENAKKYNEIFDFTIGQNEDFKKVITEFDDLRESLMREDPNTEIKIYNRTIIVNSKKKEELYLIQNGICKADNIEELKVDFAEEKETNLGMIPIKKVQEKESFVKRIINIFRKKMDEMQEKGPVLEEKRPRETYASAQAKRKEWIEEDIKVDKIIVPKSQGAKKEGQRSNEKDKEK